MVISKLSKEKILGGLTRLQEYLLYLQDFSSMDEKEFLADRRNAATVESYLRRSLETVFDLGRHILSKTFGLKELEYKQIARLLGERGIVSPDYASTLLRMAGYPNRMVHFYQEIAERELYQIVRDQLPDIEQFASEIRKFLQKYETAEK
jgi:uncharacterized protein YutE (UPF0331/DUF86 family)